MPCFDSDSYPHPKNCECPECRKVGCGYCSRPRREPMCIPDNELFRDLLFANDKVSNLLKENKEIKEERNDLDALLHKSLGELAILKRINSSLDVNIADMHKEAIGKSICLEMENKNFHERIKELEKEIDKLKGN